MTLPAAVAHIEYIANGVTTTYVYPFQIDIVGELEVRVDGALVTATIHFSVAGVGSPTGGTITFFTPPSSSLVISIRRVVAFEQLLALVPNSALPAVAIEARLDEIVKMVQQLEEEISRRPQFAVGAKSGWRYLEIPDPQPNKLLGFDSLAQQFALFDPALVLVTISPESGRGSGITQVTLNASSVAGTAIATLTNLYPASVVVEGVTIEITETFGNTNGLSTLSLGDDISISRWGSALPRTAPFETTPGNWEGYNPIRTTAAQHGYLSCDLGTFDGNGVAVITAHWTTFAPV